EGAHVVGPRVVDGDHEVHAFHSGGGSGRYTTRSTARTPSGPEAEGVAADDAPAHGDRLLLAAVGDVGGEGLEGGDVGQGDGAAAGVLDDDVHERHIVLEAERHVREAGVAQGAELGEHLLDQ